MASLAKLLSGKTSTLTKIAVNSPVRFCSGKYVKKSEHPPKSGLKPAEPSCYIIIRKRSSDLEPRCPSSPSGSTLLL